jgi:hypothetical protein
VKHTLTFLILLPLLASACPSSAAAPSDVLPKTRDLLFGVNQYNVGLPQELARYWPLNDEDAAYLKTLGCNAIRFPLYPGEVGMDEKKFLTWPADGGFDPAALGTPDWRS